MRNPQSPIRFVGVVFPVQAFTFSEEHDMFAQPNTGSTQRQESVHCPPAPHYLVRQKRYKCRPSTVVATSYLRHVLSRVHLPTPNQPKWNEPIRQVESDTQYDDHTILFEPANAMYIAGELRCTFAQDGNRTHVHR